MAAETVIQPEGNYPMTFGAILTFKHTVHGYRVCAALRGKNSWVAVSAIKPHGMG